MAKAASGSTRKSATGTRGTSVRKTAAPRATRAKSGQGAADALIGLLQSPLVAELLAAAAAAALASLSSGKKSGGKAAVKAAGAAAAAAIGQRLTSEIGSIKKSAKPKAAKAK